MLNSRQFQHRIQEGLPDQRQVTQRRTMSLMKLQNSETAIGFGF